MKKKDKDDPYARSTTNVNRGLVSKHQFYPWECLSLVRSNYTTFDIVVKDYNDLFCLLHFVFKKLFAPEEHVNFMRLFKCLKFKMKVQYEAWNRKLSVGTFINFAILKTL